MGSAADSRRDGGYKLLFNTGRRADRQAVVYTDKNNKNKIKIMMENIRKELLI